MPKFYSGIIIYPTESTLLTFNYIFV